MSKDEETLQKSAHIYWDGVRWGDWERAGVFIEDKDQRVAFRYWLQDGQEARRISDIVIMQVDVGPDLEPPVNGRWREGTVHVRLEGYTLPAQVVEKEMVTQTWYRTSLGWFAEWSLPVE